MSAPASFANLLTPAVRYTASEALRLAQRRRQGELSPGQLELAAYCGHPAAGLLGARQLPPRALEPWIAGLERWGESVWVRTAIAAASESLPELTRHSDAHAPHQAVWIARACLLSPSEALRAITEQAALRAAQVGHELRARTDSPSAQLAAYAAAATAHAALAVAARDPRRHARCAARAAARSAGEARVQRALRRALTAWALREPGEPLDLCDDAA